MIPQKTDRLLKVGILGCGPIAQFAHLEACQKAKNIDLYAICDVAEDLVLRLAAFYQPKKTYLNYEKMLEDADLEAVIIATADAFHIEATLMAIEAGKHVLVEKPLGMDIDSCEALMKLQENSKVKVQVAHMKRFDPGIAYAQKFVQEEIGELIALKAWYCDSSQRYDATDSLHPVHIHSNASKKPSVNPKADLEKYYMLAHGSHLLDTAYFLAGEIKNVQARLVEKEGIYNWFIDTEFENGCNGHLDLTVAIRADWHEGFHIYGTEGSVFAKTYNPWYYKPTEVQCYSEKKKLFSQPLDNNANFYKLQLESFADYIFGNSKQIGTNLKEGLHSVRGMLAIAQSVATGQRIYLKDVKGAL